MYGNTKIIEKCLETECVIFLCQSHNEREFIFRNACDRYGKIAKHISRNTSTILFNDPAVSLRFTSLNYNNVEHLQAAQSVILVHPDILFEHGLHEELVELIKHKNERYLPECLRSTQAKWMPSQKSFPSSMTQLENATDFRVALEQAKLSSSLTQWTTYFDSSVPPLESIKLPSLPLPTKQQQFLEMQSHIEEEILKQFTLS